MFCSEFQFSQHKSSQKLFSNRYQALSFQLINNFYDTIVKICNFTIIFWILIFKNWCFPCRVSTKNDVLASKAKVAGLLRSTPTAFKMNFFRFCLHFIYTGSSNKIRISRLNMFVATARNWKILLLLKLIYLLR